MANGFVTPATVATLGRCLKCGCPDSACKYVPKDSGFPVSKDWLKWTCARCGYTWRTRPLDAKSEEEAGR